MLLILACHMVIHFDPVNGHLRLVLLAAPGWKAALSFLIVQYGQVGVSIFFIISGYFLVSKKFKLNRIISPWLQMLVYTIALFLLSLLLELTLGPIHTFQDLFSGTAIVHTLTWSVFPLLNNSYWFISAYILVLLVSPFLNKILNNFTKNSIKLLLALLGFTSVWMLIFPSANFWNNLIYAILGYLIGGYIRLFTEKHKLSLKDALLGSLFIIGSTGSMLLFNYATTSDWTITKFFSWSSQTKNGVQLFPVLIATVLFLIFRTLNFSTITLRKQSIINKIAKTTFGIYLLHENIFGFRILWEVISRSFPFRMSYSIDGLISLLVLLAVFCILSLIASVMDTLFVHPLQSRLEPYISRLDSTMLIKELNQ